MALARDSLTSRGHGVKHTSARALPDVDIGALGEPLNGKPQSNTFKIAGISWYWWAAAVGVVLLVVIYMQSKSSSSTTGQTSTSDQNALNQIEQQLQQLLSGQTTTTTQPNGSGGGGGGGGGGGSGGATGGYTTDPYGGTGTGITTSKLGSVMNATPGPNYRYYGQTEKQVVARGGASMETAHPTTPQNAAEVLPGLAPQIRAIPGQMSSGKPTSHGTKHSAGSRPTPKSNTASDISYTRKSPSHPAPKPHPTGTQGHPGVRGAGR